MKRTIVLLLTSILLLSGCNKQEPPVETTTPEPSPVITSTPTPDPTETPEPTPMPFYNPLNGFGSEVDISDRRPFAVMTNNLSLAQPQCGIGSADIIYEVLAEGGITRMLGIFSNIDDVGPFGSIRSIRSYFIDISQAYDSIVIHAGGSEQAYSDIYSKGIDNIDGVRGAYGESVFYREQSRMSSGYEHSMFTSSDRILEYLPKFGYDAAHSSGSFDYGLSFTDNPVPAAGYSAEKVNVSFDGHKMSYFTYDSADGIYTMEQYNDDYIDGNTGEIIPFNNLIIIYAKTATIDSDGRLSVATTGTGNGHYVNGGKAENITWSREGLNNGFEYSTASGSELEIGVGKTYIAIVPTSSSIVFE